MGDVPIPKRYLAAMDLRAWFERQNIAPATVLPSERQLAERLGVGRSAVRSALELLAAEAREHASLLERRYAALPGCMEKLSPADLSIIVEHYYHGLSWESIARSLGRTASSVRHSVCRIRRELKRCIDQAVGAEEEAGS